MGLLSLSQIVGQGSRAALTAFLAGLCLSLHLPPFLPDPLWDSAGEMTDGFSLCLKYCLNPRRVTQGKKTTGEVGSKKAGDSKVKHYQIPP